MTVCVHGLGYIGLPTAAILAAAGREVVGYDTDPTVLNRLSRERVPTEEPGLEGLIREAKAADRFRVSAEPVPAEYHLICVPTPLDRRSNTADLTAVESAARTIAPLLRPGDTVILESTVPPRTTVDVVAPFLETASTTAGEDFHLAFSPETVLPGNILRELRENDRIVGGVTPESTAAAVGLYREFVEGQIHRAPDPSTAEFVKLLQNTFRDVNIALANEIAKLAADYEVDSRAAIELANVHPRVDIHDPGPGVGGHCIPLDPWFLGQDSDQLDVIASARRVNDGMPAYVVGLLGEHIESVGSPKVAILGVAYKGNVDDTRESPGLAIARQLQQRQRRRQEADIGDEVVLNGGVSEVEVVLHDAHVSDQTLDLRPLEEAVTGADALVIATDHDEYERLDPSPIRTAMDGTVVMDTRAILPPDEWREAGFTVLRI